jgi:hypothetical protein
MNTRFRRAKECCADLYSTCAQCKCRGDTSPVSDAPCGDNGNSNCIDHCGNKSDQAHHFTFGLIGIKAAPMPAGFHSLNHNHVCASRFCGLRFSDGRSIGEPRDAKGLEAINEFG